MLGLGLTLPALGVINYAVPRIGQAYLEGQTQAFEIATGFFALPWAAVFFPALLYPFGAIGFGVILWRQRLVPRLAAVLFSASAVFLAIPVPLHTVRLAGGVLLLAGGTWVANALWHRGA